MAFSTVTDNEMRKAVIKNNIYLQIITMQATECSLIRMLISLVIKLSMYKTALRKAFIIKLAEIQLGFLPPLVTHEQHEH
jgi:hypothetical protein